MNPRFEPLQMEFSHSLGGWRYSTILIMGINEIVNFPQKGKAFSQKLIKIDYLLTFVI